MPLDAFDVKTPLSSHILALLEEAKKSLLLTSDQVADKLREADDQLRISMIRSCFAERGCDETSAVYGIDNDTVLSIVNNRIGISNFPACAVLNDPFPV